jgi:hypothetical protein
MIKFHSKIKFKKLIKLVSKNKLKKDAKITNGYFV